MNASVRLMVLTAATLTTGAAWAVPIVGEAGGSFSNLSSCDNSGSDQNCRIVATTNGAATQVQWGSTSSSKNFQNPSTLTSVDVSINTQTDALNLVIGRLDWFNGATLSSETDKNFWVNWNYFINFSQPTSSADPNDTETFHLNILNTPNPSGDKIKGLTLAGLDPGIALNLNGITVSNFRYIVQDGAGNCSGVDTKINTSTSTWFNCENNWATLLIVADFKATPVQQPIENGKPGNGTSVSVPEPGSLALLGLGLAGLGFSRRRRTA